jgi:CheY-like chemotaxis protein
LGRAKPAAATPTAREFAEAQVGLLRLPAGSNATTQKRSRLLRSREGTRQLLAAGFDGYLEKPIDIREFPDQIRRYCRPEDA